MELEHLFSSYVLNEVLPILIILFFIIVYIGFNKNKRKLKLINWIYFSIGILLLLIINHEFVWRLNFIELIGNSFVGGILIVLIYYILTSIISYLVFVDIKTRNMKEWAWTLFVFSAPIIALPAYFMVRNKKQEGLPLLVDEKQNNKEVLKSIKEVLKSCPNCKSINSKNLSECEYCDANLEIN